MNAKYAIVTRARGCFALRRLIAAVTSCRGWKSFARCDFPHTKQPFTPLSHEDRIRCPEPPDPFRSPFVRRELGREPPLPNLRTVRLASPPYC